MSDTVREFFMGEGPGFSDHLQYFIFGRGYATADVPGVSMREGVQQKLKREQVGFWTLMPSAFITWIFAKSITNSAVWGGMFGIWGGVAYAGWYTSFFSAGLVGYYLRTRYGFQALPIAVRHCPPASTRLSCATLQAHGTQRVWTCAG